MAGGDRNLADRCYRQRDNRLTKEPVAPCHRLLIDIQVLAGDDRAAVVLPNFLEQRFIRRAPGELVGKNEQARANLSRDLAQLPGRGVESRVIALPLRRAPLPSPRAKSVNRPPRNLSNNLPSDIPV